MLRLTLSCRSATHKVASIFQTMFTMQVVHTAPHQWLDAQAVFVSLRLFKRQTISSRRYQLQIQFFANEASAKPKSRRLFCYDVLRREVRFNPARKGFLRSELKLATNVGDVGGGKVILRSLLSR